MFYSTAAVGAVIFSYQRLQPRLILQESEPFIPYKALLIVLSSVSPHCRYVSCTAKNERFYGKFTLRQPLSLVLIAPTHATVTPAFIPDSTHPCYGNSLAYAGLPHTNEHLCGHVVITITLTPALLSSRPG